MATKTITSATTSPQGDAIYAARYLGVKVSGEKEPRTLKWAEMRAHFSVAWRSSRFLEECVAYVNGDDALLALHPDMEYIEGGEAAPDSEEARAMRAAIRTWRERGQGLAMLKARTGLKSATLRKIVGEEAGTTARLAYGQRYPQRKLEEEAAKEEAASEAKAAPKKRAPRAKKAATVGEATGGELAAALEASVKAVTAKKAAPKRAARKRTPKAA